MINRDIKYLTISDIHLGHKRNKTKDIINNLNEFFDYFTSKSSFIDLDIIFIAGDLLDTLLELSNEDVHDIIIWLSSLMSFCFRYEIKLRILEGTPSHDWRQSKIADTLFKIMDKDIDFKYIDTLHIEYVKDLELHILYVPDEWNSDTTTTFNEVKELLSIMGIEKVDIAIMHGLFSYQIKNAPGVSKHIEEDYLNIVRHYINIGHVHTFSFYERILAQGSVDRLANGEEEPKGGILCVINNSNDDNFYFIENKLAKTFLTIELKSKDLDKSISFIDKKVKDLRYDSYVRIKASKEHPIFEAFNELKLRYPTLVLSKLTNEEESEQSSLLVNTNTILTNNYTPVTITKENIVHMLMTEVNSRYSLSANQNTLLFKTLENTNT